ncbi:MAG: lipopolysaccharide kinase InaA family protein [Myxococcota bacterium]|nr:lipopolysaccharide kinase InaA family protein [Myxococcota bacterium]
MSSGADTGRLDHAGVRWWVGPGTRDDEDLTALLDEVMQRFRSGELVDSKDDPYKQMMRLRTRDGREWLLKVRRYDGTQRLRRRWQGSKARRELDMARRVADAGVVTPLPLAAGEESSWAGLEREFLILPFVETAADLREIAAREADASVRRGLARALGECIRRLESGGIFQEDFAPNNFLVEPGPEPRVQAIDFERAELRPVRERELVFSLAKLLRELPRAGALERRALLQGLRPGDPVAVRALWQAVAAELPRQAVRDHARLVRVVSREGRRFRTLRRGDDVVRARRSLDDAALEELLGDRHDRHRLLRRELRGGEGAVPDALARAELLAHRGLGPTPLLGVAGRESWIGFAPLEDPAPPEPRAVESLLRGLLAIGNLCATPSEGALAGARSGRVALLLDASLLELGRPPRHPSRELRRLGPPTTR